MDKDDPQYPYWKPDFDKEFKGLEVIYREDGWPKNTEDVADAYRVFMILCNNRYEHTRKETLQYLKDATEENPIVINNERFWTVKLD